MLTNEYNNYLELARERYAWPGMYEVFFITDDSGTLCAPCVVTEWSECIRDADPGDGWRIEACDHVGQTDGEVVCDHCYRVIQAEGE